MTQRQEFKLNTQQTVELLKAFPSDTKFFESFVHRSRSPLFVGYRDDVIHVFSHPAQYAGAPAWNSDGKTRTLWSMRFHMINTVDDSYPEDSSEFCVLMDYAFEDQSEELPELKWSARWHDHFQSRAKDEFAWFHQAIDLGDGSAVFPNRDVADVLNHNASVLGCRFRVLLSDFFHPCFDGWRNTHAWQGTIREMKHLDWLMLTEHPDRIATALSDDWGNGWPHVWLGTKVENEDTVSRLNDLIAVPAALHFVVADPLTGPINLRPYLSNIDMVVAGCEIGSPDRRRPMHVEWVRDLRDQCREAGVPFNLSQYYTGTELHDDGIIDGEICRNVPVAPAATGSESWPNINYSLNGYVRGAQQN